MKPVVEYDRSSDAAYIRLSGETVVDSAEVSDGIVLDYDDEGRIVGMEVLNARLHLSSSLLDVA
ncbi:DUF2283 domain-containing protein [Rhizobium sp. DKSPLA3]|uniref:DUF2283 domain-containing protein n=1 Tax=Rhizobium quercicola TaxID=2901226 RepID=A0A9X1NXU4_9HYPH|nr:DUF2283 domain-containing protein [Rhizobium quercicola]MCD7111869.1 DUF2283 domain-containing protein [Rhizobium quercicola]